MSGNYDYHEIRFAIVKILVSVSNVTILQDCLCNCQNSQIVEKLKIVKNVKKLKIVKNCKKNWKYKVGKVVKIFKISQKIFEICQNSPFCKNRQK